VRDQNSKLAELITYSLNMDRLVVVGHSMSIGGENSTDGESIYDNNDPSLLTSPPIDINFTSLITAPYISLWGSISRLVTSPI
jgi:hypothetical protein